jgi:hypothetical protein
MNENKEQAMSMLNCQVDNNLNFSASGISVNYAVGTESINLESSGTANMLDNKTWVADYPQKLTCWDWWSNYYYPGVIKEYYPVYIQERALDKGKQAYEIIKMLKDKKLIEIKSVSKFMELMDALIKIV